MCGVLLLSTDYLIRTYPQSGGDSVTVVRVIVVQIAVRIELTDVVRVPWVR